MHRSERVELARQAYLRALAMAREVSTPRTWGRLLATARNLNAAADEHDAARRATGRSRNGPLPLRARRPAPPPLAEERREVVHVIHQGAESPCLAPRPLRWPGLEEDVQCARALREQARRLVEQARQLRAEIEQLLALAPARVPAGS